MYDNMIKVLTIIWLIIQIADKLHEYDSDDK